MLLAVVAVFGLGASEIFGAEAVTIANWKVGGFTDKGQRTYNEDRLVVQELSGDKVAVAVYDGSQGAWLADFMRYQTEKKLKEEKDLSKGSGFIQDLFEQGERFSRAVNADYYDKFDTHLAVSQDEFPDIPFKKIRENSPRLLQCSTTAAMALLHGNKCDIGWVGDARLVIGNKVSQKVVYKTTDHKPTQEKEKERLLDLQEKLYKNRDIAEGDLEDHVLRNIRGLLKVYGVVMVSRVIGCNMFKDAVIMKPEFYEHDMKDGDFIINACDGLWDVMTSEEGVQFVSERLEKGMEPQKISEELVAEAIRKGSTDNVTACVISSIDTTKPTIQKSGTSWGTIAGGSIFVLGVLTALYLYVYHYRA